jgi:hypothetical protein
MEVWGCYEVSDMHCLLKVLRHCALMVAVCGGFASGEAMFEFKCEVWQRMNGSKWCLCNGLAAKMDDGLAALLFSWSGFQKASAVARGAALAFEASRAQYRVAGDGDDEVSAAILKPKQVADLMT